MIAIDHRGHGRGTRAEEPFSLEACADDAAALLELLGVRQVIVVGSIDVPCCSVVTQRDRLVRPRGQRALAEALSAPVVTVDGDHDAPLMRPELFALAVTQAVETVARRHRHRGRRIRPASPWAPATSWP